MPGSSISTVRETYASYGPPEPSDEDLVSKRTDANDETARGKSVASVAASGGPTLSSAPKREAPGSGEPDYGTSALHLSLPFLTITVSHTTDHAGRDYYGLGASVGVGLSPVAGASTSAGKLLREGDRRATPDEVRDYLCGDSVSVRAGFVADAGITNSAGGTAIEWGAATSVGVSAGFSHNWGDDCP
jgi:hypothetical protein